MDLTDDEAATLAGRRILMAEDEMAMAMSMEMLFDSYHCRLIKAASVSEAQALVQSERFDGALLDINLGGEEVYPVAEALAARGIPFIFLTGYSAEHVQAPWRNRPVLEKPFLTEDLGQHVVAICTSRGYAEPVQPAPSEI